MSTLQTAVETASLCQSSSCATTGDKIICRCLKVTETEIQTAISAYNLESVREIGRCTGAGKGCMSCHGRIKALLASRQS